MGVKDLWNILSPSCEKKSLWELEGLNIAIDLSSWIVDSQSVGDNSLNNMYLRNLFFRTSYLLLLGVKPVFVLEGKAPELKHNTIARRQEISKGKPLKSTAKSSSGHRGRLNCLQKRCEELLLSMGVRCYKSKGEAEALCARLNELGAVDAVISQDSDCFLYGARMVLRNFTMSPCYTCDMYTMDNIAEKLSLGRQKLLALSLLCGCDYEAGVQGVGKQSALKFLASLPDNQVLDRLRSWQSDSSINSQTFKSQLSPEDKLELNILKKATLDPSFPSEEVISEFLSATSVNIPDFVWTKPSLTHFMMIGERYLAWEDDYIHNKFMPLLTRWHLLNSGSMNGLRLEALVKKRSVRSVPSYELSWHHDSVGHFTTVEPISLVAQSYPELHEAFIEYKKPKKTGTKGRKKKCDSKDLENVLENLNISGNITKQPIKKRAKQKDASGLQKLDRFLVKDIDSAAPVIPHSTPLEKPEMTQSYHYYSDDSLSSPLHKQVKKSLVLEKEDCAEKSHNVQSLVDSSVDSSAFDLSDIVNSIVARTDNPALSLWHKQTCHVSDSVT